MNQNRSKNTSEFLLIFKGFDCEIDDEVSMLKILNFRSVSLKY